MTTYRRYDDSVARARARSEARDRIRAILDTGHWPSGMELWPAERALLIHNARNEGLLA